MYERVTRESSSNAVYHLLALSVFPVLYDFSLFAIHE